MPTLRNGYASAFGTDQAAGVPGATDSTYYADPNLGSTAFNLGTALFGNPEVAARRALTQSQIDQNAAVTRAQNLQSTRVEGENAARGTIGDLWTKFTTVTNPDGTMRQATQDEMRANMGKLGQAFATAYSDPAQAGNMTRVFAGLSGDRNLQTNAQIAAGTPFAQTPIGQTQGEDAAKATALAVAGTQAGSAANVARINAASVADGRKWDWEHHAPTVLAPGQTLYPMANGSDPRFPDGKPVTGQPTHDTVVAQAAQAFLNPQGLATQPTPEDLDRRVRELAAPTVVNTEANNVRATDVAQLVTQGKITAEEKRGAERYAAALARGDTAINVADRAAAARVQAAIESGNARRDAANTAAGAKAPPPITPKQIDAFATGVQNALAEDGTALTDEAKLAVQTRAASYYHGNGAEKLQGDVIGSISAAIHDMKADGSFAKASWGLGNLFYNKLGASPTAPAAPQGIVPQATAAAPSTPQAAPRPSGMPPDGTPIYQNGKKYEIRNGQVVPAQ